MRLPCPFTLACTGRKLMFQRRLVTLWAWLMRFPACGFLPHISHCCAIGLLLPNDSDLVGQTLILQELRRFRQCRRTPAPSRVSSPAYLGTSSMLPEILVGTRFVEGTTLIAL